MYELDFDDATDPQTADTSIAYEPAVHGVPLRLASHALGQLDAVLAIAQRQTPGLTLDKLIADIRMTEAGA